MSLKRDDIITEFPTNTKKKDEEGIHQRHVRNTFKIVQKYFTENEMSWDLSGTYLQDLCDDNNQYEIEHLGKEANQEAILVEFYASRNYLEGFSNHVVRILGRCIFTQSLRKLNLSCNNLTKFPPLKELVNLQELLLSNNKISEIDPQLENCINLEKLDLKMNRITSLQNLPLPANGATNNKLVYLSLSCNQLAEINDTEMRKCGNLQHLGLFGNLIETPLTQILVLLSESCGNALQELWLQANPITPISSITADENVLGVHNRVEIISQTLSLSRDKEIELVQQRLPALSHYNGTYLN
ncbi:hypothetical protein C9374_008585 [Naegleria lovaniensis]|uniref:Uncharacterized protein n=1 Tax=Naegleria lovaniensis TaxID=51637 RepID=A0AA88GKT0_NAELO|nr:uncharacterized protein C9374_008585 [Naegleria lovaniensis]KAG2377963.1 hypothetical protein C9374_008585 [Naegleria lovaniensis]